MLMADTPAQTKEDMMKKRKTRGEKYWQDAQDGLFTDLDWRQEVDLFMKENSDTKIFCFHLTNWAKQNFDEIAKIGNGKSSDLYVNDQEESVSRLTGALAETILFKVNGNNMELVKQFRNENKSIPTFLRTDD